MLIFVEIMQEFYDMGFNLPEYITHRAGIILYIGTKNQADWAITIPRYLVNRVNGDDYTYREFTFYNVTYEMALSLAQKYMRGWAEYHEKRCYTNAC